MIVLEVNGIQYTNFSNIEIESAMDTLSGTFKFATLTVNPGTGDLATDFDKVFFNSSDAFPLPIKIEEPCKIIVDDQTILTGFIDAISSSYTKENHILTIQGADRTHDAIIATIGSKPEFAGDISLRDIIKKTLETNDINNMDVIDLVGGLKNFSKTDIESPAIGSKLFDFIESLAKKRQVFLSTDGLGNITIIRSSNDVIDDRIVNKNGESNIISAQWSLNHKDRFGKYVIFSQQNPSALGAGSGVDTKKITSLKGESIDASVRFTKVLHIKADRTYDQETLTKRAIWEQNIRRSRSYTYTCVVSKHSMASGDTWTPNTLIRVIDALADLNAIMLINNVTYKQSLSTGSTTDLSLITQDAYKLQANEPGKQQKSSTKGGVITPTDEQLDALLRAEGIEPSK